MSWTHRLKLAARLVVAGLFLALALPFLIVLTGASAAIGAIDDSWPDFCAAARDLVRR